MSRTCPAVLILLLLVGAAGLAEPDAPPRSPSGRHASDPAVYVSESELLGALEELTAIGAHSGWRTATTRGEEAALSFLEQRLHSLEHLRDLGLELERQRFRTPEGIEMWESRLELTVAGSVFEVPADALLGAVDNLYFTMNVDTDGTLNDADPNPEVGSGPVILVRTSDELEAMEFNQASGRVVLADYALFDPSVQTYGAARANAARLGFIRPAGAVLVTRFSDSVGESHGTESSGRNLFTYDGMRPPMVSVRIEDLGSAGIASWDDLVRIEEATITIDVDVFSPGASSNLIARIPGRDSSRALILGAHVDTVNTPGALDDGSGVVSLLEAARVIDQLHLQPAVDSYLVFFGSHEVGLYGSTSFAAAHPELLDRAIALLQIDCLYAPLEGVGADLLLEAWSYWRFGDEQRPWLDRLLAFAGSAGVQVSAFEYPSDGSDNGSVTGLDVPNANLSTWDPYSGLELHYAGHLHSPYDTVEVVRGEVANLRRMAQLALAAVLGVDESTPELRVTPTRDRRAVFVASHTEAPHMTPVHLVDLGMALAWSGFDVDMVHYGQQLTAPDLEDADLVVALPVHDYPSEEGDLEVYDEAWSSAEVELLERHVADGGLLVLTNSKHRLKFFNFAYEDNEDWADANALAELFGVAYEAGAVDGDSALVEGDTPLTTGLSTVAMVEGNGVPFTLSDGQVLARARDGSPAMALLDHGTAGGQVLVLADLGILGDDGHSAANLQLFLNLADWARSR